MTPIVVHHAKSKFASVMRCELTTDMMPRLTRASHCFYFDARDAHKVTCDGCRAALGMPPYAAVKARAA